LERLIPRSLSLPFTKWINLQIEMKKKSCKTAYTKLQYYSAHGHTWGAHGWWYICEGLQLKSESFLLMDLPIDLGKWINGLQEVKSLSLREGLGGENGILKLDYLSMLNLN
jgi:hypothetical protein